MKSRLFGFIFIIFAFSFMFASGQLTITNESECLSTGECHYNYTLPSWFSIDAGYSDDYDVIINVKDPAGDWHGYWETLTQCISDGKCTNVSSGNIDFSYTHPEDGNVYVNIQVDDTWYNDWTAAYMYHDVAIDPYLGVISIGDETFCNDYGLCGITFSNDFIDGLTADGTSTKDIILDIRFGSKGRFKESLNYCIVNKYCKEDDDGNLVFWKYYMLDSFTGEISTTVFHPTLGEIPLQVLPVDVDIDIGDIEYTLKLSPQSYINDDGEDDHIGPLFLMNNLLMLADSDNRPLLDMRVSGYEKRVTPSDATIANGSWFIYADVPIGYQIKTASSGINLSNADSGWTGPNSSAISVVTVEEFEIIFPEHVKSYIVSLGFYSAEEITLINGAIDNCVGGAENIYVCLGGLANSIGLNGGAITGLQDYKPTTFFAIYKIEIPDTPGGLVLEAELEYKSSMPELFEEESGDEIWGKSEYSLFKSVLSVVSIGSVQLCVTIGDDGSDDQIYVQFTDELDDDGHTQIFYLDTANNDWSKNQRECFFINIDDVGLEKKAIKDIEYIKLAKYPFDISTSEPKSNPGNDLVEIDKIELFVNGQRIFESVDNMNFLMSDPDNDPESHGPECSFLISESMRIMYPDLFKDYILTASETKNVKDEIINIYRAITAKDFYSTDYIKQNLESAIGNMSLTDVNFYMEGYHFTLETWNDRVRVEYETEDLAEIKFGLTDGRGWKPDLDIYIAADLEIEYIDNAYSVVLGNYVITGDRTLRNLQRLARFAAVFLPQITYGLFSAFDFIKDAGEFGAMDFDETFKEMAGKIDEEVFLDKMSDAIVSDMVFASGGTSEGIALTYTNQTLAYMDLQNLFFTCLDNEIYGNSSCFSTYPKTIEAIQAVASE